MFMNRDRVDLGLTSCCFTDHVNDSLRLRRSLSLTKARPAARLNSRAYYEPELHKQVVINTAKYPIISVNSEPSSPGNQSSPRRLRYIVGNLLMTTRVLIPSSKYYPFSDGYLCSLGVCKQAIDSESVLLVAVKVCR